MNDHTRRTALKFIQALTAFILLAGCKPVKHSESATIAVTIGTPLVSPIVLGSADGAWEANDLKVKTLKLLLGRACLDAVLSGDADVATVAETPIVHSAARGIELEVLCVFSSSDEHVHVAARRDDKISTPADLEGKTIATAVGRITNIS